MLDDGDRTNSSKSNSIIAFKLKTRAKKIMEPTCKDENRNSKTNKQTNKHWNHDDEKKEKMKKRRETDKSKKRKFRTAISFCAWFRVYSKAQYTVIVDTCMHWMMAMSLSCSFPFFLFAPFILFLSFFLRLLSSRFSPDCYPFSSFIFRSLVLYLREKKNLYFWRQIIFFSCAQITGIYNS